MERPKKILRVGDVAELSTLDPRQVQDTDTVLPLAQVFDTLFTVTTKYGATAAGLADTHLKREQDEGGRQAYSVGVRAVAFSDGTTLTPRIAQESLKSGIAHLAAVEVRGDRLFFILTRPNPKFELALTDINYAITLEQGGRLLGTGAFMFESESLASIQRAKTFRLVRNPRHHANDAVRIDEVTFAHYPGSEELMAAVRRGEIDYTAAASAREAKDARAAGFPAFSNPGISTGILFFNTKKPGFTAQMRKGLALAVVKYDLAEIVNPDNYPGYVAPGILPSAMARDKDLLAPNPREAAAILASPAGRPPQEITLLAPWHVRPYAPEPKRMGEVIVGHWRKAGVDARLLEPPNKREHEDLIRGGVPWAFLGGQSPNILDAVDFYEDLILPERIPGPGRKKQSNYARWESKAAMDALDTLRKNPNDENRQALNRVIADEVPFIPLVYGPAVAVLSKRVQGYTAPAPGSAPLFASLGLQS